MSPSRAMRWWCSRACRARAEVDRWPLAPSLPRRSDYLESVAPYARRLIDQAGVPDVDAIDGLPMPAVALQQARGVGNARARRSAASRNWRIWCG